MKKEIPSLEEPEKIPEAREGKEKLVIEKIYQLTHPEYDLSFYGRGEERPRHKELRSIYQEKINQIAAEPGSILFYVSAFPQEAFRVLGEIKQGKKVRGMEKWVAEAAAIERDLKRILDAKQKLGRRLILLFTQKLFPEDGPEGPFLQKQRERLRSILKTKDMELPGHLPIHCFGEYSERCVEREARKLAMILGIPEMDFDTLDSPFIKQIPELSLSVKDPDSFVKRPSPPTKKR